MNIQLNTLLDAIRESTRIIKVCVPSEDYYSRSGDWCETRISVIDPHKLIEFLESNAARK